MEGFAEEEKEVMFDTAMRLASKYGTVEARRKLIYASDFSEITSIVRQYALRCLLYIEFNNLNGIRIDGRPQRYREEMLHIARARYSGTVRLEDFFFPVPLNTYEKTVVVGMQTMCADALSIIFLADR